MELQEQLKELYAGMWDGLKDELGKIVGDKEENVKPAYPFLLSLAHWENGRPNENWYVDADVKVMIFGQETNGWSGEADDFGTPPSPIFNAEVTMEAIMAVYEDFYSSHYRGNGFRYNGNRYGTFHHGASRLMDLINVKFSGKRVSFLWNNVVKIGKASGAGFCGEKIYGVERMYFPVIKEEIKILKPDLIIFLTGSYDERLQDSLGNISFGALGEFSGQEVAKVVLPGIDIPAFRTYHPSARVSKELKEAIYRAIIACL